MEAAGSQRSVTVVPLTETTLGAPTASGGTLAVLGRGGVSHARAEGEAARES